MKATICYGGKTMAEQENTTEQPVESAFRPLTRAERRGLWLREYEGQDVALQTWVRLVEQQQVEIEVMFQMHGLLVFGTMISTATYAQFYIDLYENMYRQEAPETADVLRDYYQALIPPPDQPEIGAEGLPFIFRHAHLRATTILSAGHRSKVPYWRGKLSDIDAFVIGASASE